MLLLANVLEPAKIKELAKFAGSLGLEVLLEIREKEELAALNEFVDVIGINNRNLKDFTVNISQSFELGSLIPHNFIKISESGIDSAKVINDLKAEGFRGFLIGETFMKNSRPERACADLIREVNLLKNNLITV